MKLRMEGHDTFVAAVAAFTDASRTACALADVDLRSIDLLVLHQANGRITSAVADRLDVPEGRVMDCIGTTGNTSAASIPLALSLARESGRLRAGDTVLLAAVGAGFTSGAAVMTWGLA
jgi:3-oxoacyl-[acyl-carrier-protein] synthase-3